MSGQEQAESNDSTVMIVNVDGQLVVELYPGHTVAEIVERMNAREARVEGESPEEIVWHSPDMDVGEVSMARVIERVDGKWEHHVPHRCPVVTPQQRDRNQAENLAVRAHREVDQGNLRLAQALMKASRALIRHAGDWNCEAYIWLLTAQAQLATVRGESDRAINLSRRIYRLAVKVHGEDHPTTVICFGNIGESLHAAGRMDEAKPYLEKGLAYFGSLNPFGKWTAEWIQGTIIPHYSKLLSDASQTADAPVS